MPTKLNNVQPAEMSAPQIVELTIAASVTSANDGHVNAYEARNAILMKRRKERIRYENGYTLPASAELLLANAENLSYNHRRTLSRNISKFEQAGRPAEACAHHIVALADDEADRSRRRLFKHGIGINDADNGVHLPRYKIGLPGYPKASHHNSYHRKTYHIEVFMRLLPANDVEQHREALRIMKADLLAGRMSL